ncbi:hypothetical protein BC833DRAFT_36182 [Globomyces pollinis-pini]|nr:hypothetical protein BC833DRAFT_36182 [Globomyces pollinis-pini]
MLYQAHVKSNLSPKSSKVKKPMNAFFVYRKQMRQKIMDIYNVSKSQDISKIAGQSWSLEPESVKKHYYQMALEHQLLNQNANNDDESLITQQRLKNLQTCYPMDFIQSLQMDASYLSNDYGIQNHYEPSMYTYQFQPSVDGTLNFDTLLSSLINS